MLVKCRIRFVDTKKYSPEDSLFNLTVSLSTDRIKFIDKTLYLYSVNDVSLSHGKESQSESGMFGKKKVLGSMDLWYDVLAKHDSLDGYDIRLAKTIMPYQISLNEFSKYAPLSSSYLHQKLKEKGAFHYALKMSFMIFPIKRNLGKFLLTLGKTSVKGIMGFPKKLQYFKHLQKE